MTSMKTNLVFFLLIVSFLFVKCKKEIIDDNPNTNVIVLAKSADCTNAFLLKFDKNVIGLPNNYQDFTFNEINLPDEYKIAGKKLTVTFRRPTNDEYIDCGSPIISYPQIFIITAH